MCIQKKNQQQHEIGRNNELIRGRQSTEIRYSSRVPEYRQFLEWSRVEYRHAGVLLRVFNNTPEWSTGVLAKLILQEYRKSSTRVVLRSTGKIDTPGVPKKVVLEYNSGVLAQLVLKEYRKMWHSSSTLEYWQS